MLCRFNNTVDHFQHIGADKIPLSLHTNADSVPIQNCTVLHELLQLDFGQLHQTIHLVLRSVVVLDAKGIDSDDLDTTFVADFKDLRKKRGVVRFAVLSRQGETGRTLARASKPR